jgi:hypothetical protein
MQAALHQVDQCVTADSLLRCAAAGAPGARRPRGVPAPGAHERAGEGELGCAQDGAAGQHQEGGGVRGQGGAAVAGASGAGGAGALLRLSDPLMCSMLQAVACPSVAVCDMLLGH